jgi:DNA repair ATPase RecN
MGKFKYIWYILLVITVIILLNFVLNIFNKSEISKAKDDIRSARQKIENAMLNIDSAQMEINGLIQHIDTTKHKIKEMNKSLNLLNLTMGKKIDNVSFKIKRLMDSVKADQQNLNLLKKELEKIK